MLTRSRQEELSPMGIDTDLRGTARPKEPAGHDDPVLASKLTVPHLPGWVVARSRVDQLIAAGARGPLTIVTGPPGAGKTMAVALWAAASHPPGTVVWITLDHYDNRPRVFWSYVVAALRRAGIEVPRVLTAPARSAVDHGFLLGLASVLAAQDTPVIMVLDDLHMLTEPVVLDGLAYVLRNAAPGLHLVASSRMDPLLPLHRYRLMGELAEIRADDLAFSVAESGLLMAQHGITLSTASLERLTGATEGWAAGVRLAALSMNGHDDPEQFTKELDAEDSAVTGYLVDEVLNTQPAPVRDLLLRTSILDCVSADLASELAGDEHAASTLHNLTQTNAFVRPLGQGWYRYHSMFAAVLRLKLRSEYPGRLSELHRRAALWFRRNGCVTQAVRHAADCGDWPFAAGIVLDELAIDQLLDPRGDESLADVFRRMPPDLAGTRPEPLLVAAAMELSGAADGPGGPVVTAEAIPDGFPPDGDVAVRLAAALVRLALSRRTGNAGLASTAAASAAARLDELPAGLLARHPGIRAQVLSACGAAYLRAGRLDDAVAAFRTGAQAAAAPDSARGRTDCLAYLALVEALGGRLSRAAGLAEEAAQVNEASGEILIEHIAPAASVALASVHLDRNEMPQAHAQLRLAEAALRADPRPADRHSGRLIAARRRLAGGRTRGALEIIGLARRGWSPPDWLEHRLTLLESRRMRGRGGHPGRGGRARRADPASCLTPPCARLRVADRGRLSGRPGSPGHLAQKCAEVAPEQARLDGWLLDARLSYADAGQSRRRPPLTGARAAAGQAGAAPAALHPGTDLDPAGAAVGPDLCSAYRELLRAWSARHLTRQLPRPGRLTWSRCAPDHRAADRA